MPDPSPTSAEIVATSDAPETQAGADLAAEEQARKDAAAAEAAAEKEKHEKQRAEALSAKAMINSQGSHVPPEFAKDDPDWFSKL